MPEEDFHLSNQARFQAHVGTRCPASGLGFPLRTRSSASLPLTCFHSFRLGGSLAPDLTGLGLLQLQQLR